MSEYIYFICLVVYYSPILQGDMFLYFIWRFWKISMLSPHIARDLLYWHPYTNNYVLNAWRELNISGDVCYFYKNESKKNLNNYLDLNVFMHNKINKKFFFLISVMVMKTSPCGQTPYTKIAGYDNLDYEGYTSSPTRMQVLRYYFCNYIHLYCVFETLKNTIKLTCF